MDKYLNYIIESYETTLNDFKKDEEVESYFKSEKDFLDCINTQRKILELSIMDFQEQKLQRHIDKYEKFYLSLDFPYILLMKYFNILKRNAIKKLQTTPISNDQDITQGIMNITFCIDSCKNIISNIFILKEAMDFRSQEKSKFQEFQLFYHHLSWIEQIVHAILEKDLQYFPLKNYKECAYSKVMLYPESLMVCMDASMCKQLELLHELVHKQAETFYRFFIRKEYIQAYFVFKELMENVEKLLSLLKDLYYITYSDLENSFFQLLEMLSYSDKKQILTVVDIQRLKQLNNRYGEDKLDKIINEIEIFLKEKTYQDPKHNLLIRGISSSFYLLHINCKDPVVYQSYINDLIADIEQIVKEKFSQLEISFSVASFSLDQKVQYQRDELRRIILELKNRAKLENSILFYYKQEDQNEIRKWLNERYFTINFLQKKIKNKEIGVMLQPIYDTKTKELYAVEALARVKDNGKLLPAGMFIDTLYEINLVTELDMLMLDAILEKKEYIMDQNVKIFINSSAESLSEKQYIDKLYVFLTNFEPGRIVIEITEQQALNNLDILRQFHKKTNVKFAIDDFGTGYSALKTVSDMVEEGLISVLKMDGSLIDNLDKEVQTQKIVKIIAQMCATFSIHSLAEFIENEETLQLLQSFDVDLSQGFYLAQPMIAEELYAYNIFEHRT